MNKILFLLGPTGVGKTALSLELGKKIPIEIINCDSGQLYTPLTIGTAKPDWRTEPIPHHLFDCIDLPVNFTVMEYRSRVDVLIKQIHARGALPVIVGGSFFYARSLFFPTQDSLSSPSHHMQVEDCSWEALNRIDPIRAAAIHPHDRYRIERALAIWHTTGMRPSVFKPMFAPVGNECIVIHCSRDTADLYSRIDERVEAMVEQGWIDEVASLDKAWRAFMHEKKIIGYSEIDTFLQNGNENALTQLIAEIQKKTRNYAKRQGTAWRTLKKDLLPHTDVVLKELDLTLSPVELYIDQLLSILTSDTHDKKNSR